MNRRTMLARTGLTFQLAASLLLSSVLFLGQIAPVALLGTVVVTQTACPWGSNAIKTFRAVLRSSAPLARSLNLPAATVTRIVNDFDEGAQCAEALQSDFSNIPKGAPDERSQRYQAAQKAVRCWRPIVDRQNFAAHPRIQQAADIADGILSSIVIFYSDPGQEGMAAGNPRAVRAVSEEDLEKQLRGKVKELERALKP